MNVPIDISPGDLETVREILAKHVPEHEVRAFGSRVTWTARQYSDLDLAVMTEKPLDILRTSDLCEAFTQSDLPFQVDIVDWAGTSENFREIIEKEHAVVQQAIREKSQMADNWCRIQLSDVAKIIMGQSPPSSTYNETGDGLPFFQGVRDFNYRHPLPRVFCSKPSRIAQPGDILFSVRAPIGRVNIADRECATGRGLAIIRPHNKSDTRYLEFLLRDMETGWDAIEGSGSVFGNATKQDLEMLPLLWPRDKQERDAIAHTLGTLDDKIELNRQTSETLEAMAQALFKSWFVDFDPIRAKMEGRWHRNESLLGLPKELWDLFPDRFTDSEMGRIPEGWEIIPLPEVIDYKEGPGIRNWQYTNSEEGTHFINIRCIQDGDIVLSDANRIRDEEANGKYAHFHLKEWDVVISTSGTLGRSAIVRREHLPLVLNTSVIRFRPIKGKTLFSFLNGYLNSPIFLDELKSMASGSVQKNFGPTHLKKMSVLCPKFNCIKQYDRFVGPLLQNSIKRKTESDNLSTLRNILLPKLISGNIRFKSTEKLIGTVI